MKRDELRAMIDNHELWKNDGADGYNVASDHLADELSKLFPPMPEPVHYVYRDCDADRLTRTLDQTKPTEEVVTVIVGQYGRNLQLGYRIILKCTGVAR